ncbi:MAG: putative acyltransferase [Bacteroidetes bacterium]|nr:putative acyltransferase [Bacteroidota bacterium]
MALQKAQHVPILDSLRAIAALSVCLYHFVCGPVNFISNETVLDVFTFGKYGVQLFFVISGFIIPWSVYHNDYRIGKYFKFLLKRFLRLEPPYLVSIALALGILFFRGFYADLPESRAISAEQVLLHIGYFIPFSSYRWILDVYWTLAVEFQFYLFMGLFYFVTISEKIALRIAGYALVIGLSFIGTRNFLFYWLPVFLLGNMLFLFLAKRIGKAEFYSMMVILLAQIAVFLPGPVFFSSLIPAAAILYMFSYSNRVLDWIGKISYSIYLLHTIVGTTVINILSHHAHSPLTKALVVLVGVGVSIVCSYFMYLFVEKPSKRLSSKIKL